MLRDGRKDGGNLWEKREVMEKARLKYTVRLTLTSLVVGVSSN